MPIYHANKRMNANQQYRIKEAGLTTACEVGLEIWMRGSCITMQVPLAGNIADRTATCLATIAFISGKWLQPLHVMHKAQHRSHEAPRLVLLTRITRAQLATLATPPTCAHRQRLVYDLSSLFRASPALRCPRSTLLPSQQLMDADASSSLACISSLPQLGLGLRVSFFLPATHRRFKLQREKYLDTGPPSSSKRPQHSQ